MAYTPLVREFEGKPSPEFSDRLLASLDTGAAKARDPKAEAWSPRMRRMCLQANADRVKALEWYDKALAVDPKVEVWRRAEKIRKAVGTGAQG